MATEKLLVDANEAYEIARSSGRHDDFGRCMADLTSLKELLEDCTTVDAVEVVRCRDCRWYNLELGICNLHSESKGEPNVGYVVGMDPDDFCSYGERRE